MDRRVLVFLSAVSLLLLSDMSFSTAQKSGGRKATKSPDESVLKLKKDASPPTRHTVNPSRAEQISLRPRVYIYKGFLTNQECDHLISLARGKLEKSMVVDRETGEGKESEVRTCSDMSIGRKQEEIIEDIEERIAAWTFLPTENGEDLQVQRYKAGEKYYPHYDYFEDKENLAFGGQRVATVLMYLTDVAEGGETVFPYSEEKDSQEKGNNWSDCGKEGLAANDAHWSHLFTGNNISNLTGRFRHYSNNVNTYQKVYEHFHKTKECLNTSFLENEKRMGSLICMRPKKGDALLFFSLNPNATLDHWSLHGGCPIIKGEKWSATKWIHVKPLEEEVCTDRDDQCHAWAAMGECKHNPAYMVGTDQHPGHCRKSCKAC